MGLNACSEEDEELAGHTLPRRAPRASSTAELMRATRTSTSHPVLSALEKRKRAIRLESGIAAETLPAPTRAGFISNAEDLQPIEDPDEAEALIDVRTHLVWRAAALTLDSRSAVSEEAAARPHRAHGAAQRAAQVRACGMWCNSMSLTGTSSASLPSR